MTITRLALAAAGVAVLTACSSPGASAPPTVEPVPPVSGTPEPSRTGTSAGEPDLGSPETVATGLDVPWGLAFRPDGSALVAERDTGRILEIAAGGGKPREVYRVRGVESGGEGGLLGLAVKDDWVYAYHTAADDNRIIRFKLSGGDPEVIFDGIVRGGRHNGGRLAFGPDGMLYVGTGDASAESRSQDRDDPSGKILRLTPEGKPAPGNPWAGSPVWSLGHRNVQGLAWDSQDRMYGIEFGQDTWDEVNVIEAGKNYGWPEVEGKGDGNTKFTDPIVQWGTDDASPSGAAVAGDTLYVAGLKGERLWTVPLGGGTAKAEFTGEYGRLRTVAVAPDGSLWLTTSNTDGRGDPKSGDDRILRFPAR
ncbi:PQQ-dependent sugar dehydrogenase [Actinoplanes couchii]|uniref:Oxidoreductase n=1 Tax=Actinoplanes couchii TaxID=403638 RepID=A0ABQ3X4R2_9ACTN|nr:PQQ-dependent sugar dehydrogenase [Actinoplanes couchii]MDR6326176.1 glucose/arabinose dehydrogenase [Actinoplanes couchii]GID53471.1 oxidoreductase [Actinoplanes couchii]